MTMSAYYDRQYARECFIYKMTGVREMRWSHALYGCCRYNVIKMQRGREVDYEKDEEI